MAALGVPVWRGHDPSHVEGARAVVVTAAVPPEHPELQRARALGIPVVRRADALGELVAGGSLVAVAGTHGKTTTTVMVTEALTAAGRNPTGLAGGRVAAWGGNARVGGGDLFVVEADEYDKAFLSLKPTVAVVNNVEADHLECYGSMEALEEAFAEFAGRAQRVIVGADDAGADRVATRVSAPLARGTRRAAECAFASTAEPAGRGRPSIARWTVGSLELAILGCTTAQRRGALAAVHALGADVRGAGALAGFHGWGAASSAGRSGWRDCGGLLAHHTTESRQLSRRAAGVSRPGIVRVPAALFPDGPARRRVGQGTGGGGLRLGARSTARSTARRRDASLVVRGARGAGAARGGARACGLTPTCTCGRPGDSSSRSAREP